MNSLGIYFGPKAISMVETKAKKVVNNIQIPLETITAGELEEKVPDEVKIVALCKEELRRNKIEAKKTFVSISGKDLVIRTFDMPLMPREELVGAINFEAKKYIPFKLEELILDHQLIFDKTTNKNLILLVGIKKEILDKYSSIFSQLNLEVSSVEYSAFSILRLLKLAGLRDKGVFGIISADLKEKDEVNFTVLENGFPLFSRDITLTAGPEEITGTKEMEPGMLLEKLKTEIRVSLDYYHRKFPLKNIERIFLISDQDYRSDLEAFIKEMGLSTQFIDVIKFTGKPLGFSLSFIKGYSSSLSKIIKTPLKIDLLSAKTRLEKEVVVPLKAEVLLLRGLRIEPRIVILALLICIATFIFGLYQKLPLQRELGSLRSIRPQVSTVNPDSSFEELSNIDSTYKAKIIALDNLIKKQLYLTEPLDIIPRLIPEGIWLKAFSFRKEDDKAELLLEGTAYLADSDKEFKSINSFLSKLKEDAIFAKHFSQINIVSLNSSPQQDITVTDFVITCRSDKGRE